MKGFVKRSGLLVGLGLTVLGTVVQAAVEKSPDANTLWQENGVAVETVKAESAQFWTDQRWSAGDCWLSGGLWSDVTADEKGGLRVTAVDKRILTAVKVPFNRDYPYIVWEVDNIALTPGYHDFSVGLDAPDVLGMVGNIQTGAYVFNPFQRHPEWSGQNKGFLMIRLFNAALTVKGLKMVKEPENNLTINSTAFAEKKRLDSNDSLTITLTLAKPANGASVDFFDSYLCTPVTLNGQKTLPLQAADATKKIWSATVSVKSCMMPNLKKGEQIKPNRLLFKATTRDGGLTAPLWTGNPYEFALNSSVQVMGAPKFAAGKHDQGLSFDGEADALAVPACEFADNEGTMECWIFLSPTFDKSGNIFRIDGAAPWSYHILNIDGKTRKLTYNVYNGKAGTAVNSGIIGDGWHHVMATHSIKDKKIELFVDGVSEGTAAYDVATTCKGKTLGIGGYAMGKVATPFSGLLDEIRISNVVRSAPAQGAGPFAMDDKTTVLIHCDRATGITDAAAKK
jgi:hypothetical protein